MKIVPDNWGELFVVETPLLELIARGALLYLAILVFMRVLPRRTGGEVAHMDLIFMLIIAEGAAHSLGEYTSVTEGVIVIATLMVLNYLLNFLSFYSPLVERLLTARPLEIVRNGKPIRQNMRAEFVTQEELMSYLRQNGVAEMKEAKLVVVEGKGKLSVIPLKE